MRAFSDDSLTLAGVASRGGSIAPGRSDEAPLVSRLLAVLDAGDEPAVIRSVPPAWTSVAGVADGAPPGTSAILATCGYRALICFTLLHCESRRLSDELCTCPGINNRPRPGVKENFFLCSVRKRKWGADWLGCQSDRLLPGRRGLNTARDSIKISPVVCMMRDRPGSAHAHRENA